MARVAIVKPENLEDPAIKEIFAWVTEVESAVPNHFYVEMNFPEFLKAKLGATQILWKMGELSFAAYNRLNLALDTDYDYRDMWRAFAFGWEQKPGVSAGDNTRGVR
jgi:hypothetical protein